MQVVEWVLGPVHKSWTSPQWQQRLATVDAFLACFMPLQLDAGEGVQVRMPCSWVRACCGLGGVTRLPHAARVLVVGASTG